MIQKTYQIFVSYSSKYRNEFVRPLCMELVRRGIRVWYDEFELSLGDSLRKKIEFGLSNSEFGLVVITPDFLSKGWTEYELGALLSRQLAGSKVVLPLLLNIEASELLSIAPGLADLVHLTANSMTVKEVADEVISVIDRSNVSSRIWGEFYTPGAVFDIYKYSVSIDLRISLPFGATGILSRRPDDLNRNYIVTNVDSENKYVYLKDLTDGRDPWRGSESRYREQRVMGTIRGVNTKNLLVELEPGLLAELPNDELSWATVNPNIQQSFSVGDTIIARVLYVRAMDKQVLLTLLADDTNDNFDVVRNLHNVGDNVSIYYPSATNGTLRGILEGGSTYRIECPQLNGAPTIDKRYLYKAQKDIVQPVVIGFREEDRTVLVGTYLNISIEDWPLVERSVEIKNREGKWTKQDGAVYRITQKYSCQILLSTQSNPTQLLSGHELMTIMMLVAGQGSVLVVQTRGHNAEECADEICAYFTSIAEY